ncbi:MAG: S1 RNA-binding domain-containing protein [Ferruginibacter sp.]
MSLSIKQMTEDPWSTIETVFPEHSKHKGVVKNITPYGVFVELSTGIGGMIHISDLSWLKRFNNPNEYTKVGETIDVIIMNIDKEGRKLQLGHKQIEEDPWNTLETTFPVGSIHEGTVVKKDDKGAVVQLLMDWKDLLLPVILTKKMVKQLVQTKPLHLWLLNLTVTISVLY